MKAHYLIPLIILAGCAESSDLPQDPTQSTSNLIAPSFVPLRSPGRSGAVPTGSVPTGGSLAKWTSRMSNGTQRDGGSMPRPSSDARRSG
jgi:hypothetical protein